MKKTGRVLLLTVACTLMFGQVRAMALEGATTYGTASIVFVEGASPPPPPSGGGNGGGRDRDRGTASVSAPEGEELVTILNPKSPAALPAELPKTGGATPRPDTAVTLLLAGACHHAAAGAGNRNHAVNPPPRVGDDK